MQHNFRGAKNLRRFHHSMEFLEASAGFANCNRVSTGGTLPPHPKSCSGISHCVASPANRRRKPQGFSVDMGTGGVAECHRSATGSHLFRGFVAKALGFAVDRYRSDALVRLARCGKSLPDTAMSTERQSGPSVFIKCNTNLKVFLQRKYIVWKQLMHTGAWQKGLMSVCAPSVPGRV